ncbi:MAG: hypothetical protein IK143_01755 [Bacteroidales bacterium]|nr:hypothetical protein [Bacteroidales bacterium]
MRTLITVIASLLSIVCFSQTNEPLKNIDVENSVFLNRMENVNLEMGKDSVISLMGKPYKMSSIKTRDGIVYEGLSYRAFIYKRTYNSALIIYTLVFRDSRLIMINEKEHLSSEHHIEGRSSVDLWEVARNYGDIK